MSNVYHIHESITSSISGTHILLMSQKPGLIVVSRYHRILARLEDSQEKLRYSLKCVLYSSLLHNRCTTVLTFLLTRHHVTLSQPAVQLMATGAHTMQEISCTKCSSYLGWHILKAHEKSEKWKEGNFLLELENLYATTEILVSPPSSRSGRANPRQRLSSDSDDSF